MSWTPSVGALGASYWSHMAFVMMRRLQQVLEKKRITSEDIPKGVLADAQTFFTLVRDSCNGARPRDLAASNSAYLVARGVIQAEPAAFDPEQTDIPTVLSTLGDFVENLPREMELSDDDLAVVRELQVFFSGLHEAGSAERYGQGVDSGDLAFQSVEGLGL